MKVYFFVMFCVLLGILTFLSVHMPDPIRLLITIPMVFFFPGFLLLVIIGYSWRGFLDFSLFSISLSTGVLIFIGYSINSMSIFNEENLRNGVILYYIICGVIIRFRNVHAETIYDSLFQSSR